MTSRRHAIELLAASFAVLAPAARAKAAQGPAVRIATAAGDSYALPFYALDGGFFAKHGVNAEVQLFPTGGTVMQALAGNAADVGLADAIGVANAFARGVPFSFFAGGGLYRSEAPTSVLCVAKNAPFKKPKDLEGQTIALISLNSVSEIAVRRWLDANHVDAGLVKLFALPGSEMASALARGTVAAGFIAEPALSAALQSGTVVAFAKPFDAIAGRFSISSWFASRDWLAANASVAVALAAAIGEAARWSNAHPELTAPILAKYSRIDLERVSSMTRVQMATSLDPASLQPVLDAAAQFKLIAAPVSANRLITTVGEQSS